MSWRLSLPKWQWSILCWFSGSNSTYTLRTAKASSGRWISIGVFQESFQHTYTRKQPNRLEEQLQLSHGSPAKDQGGKYLIIARTFVSLDVTRHKAWDVTNTHDLYLAAQADSAQSPRKDLTEKEVQPMHSLLTRISAWGIEKFSRKASLLVHYETQAMALTKEESCKKLLQLQVALLYKLTLAASFFRFCCGFVAWYSIWRRDLLHLNIETERIVSKAASILNTRGRLGCGERNGKTTGKYENLHRPCIDISPFHIWTSEQTASCAVLNRWGPLLRPSNLNRGTRSPSSTVASKRRRKGSNPILMPSER